MAGAAGPPGAFTAMLGWVGVGMVGWAKEAAWRPKAWARRDVVGVVAEVAAPTLPLLTLNRYLYLLATILRVWYYQRSMHVTIIR